VIVFLFTFLNKFFMSRLTVMTPASLLATIFSSLSKATIGWYPVLPTPNYLKAIPIKIFEYMAAGLPIVCSNMGFVKAIIEQVQCGLLAEPGNPEAHAVALLHLLEHPEEARKMGENGRRAVLEEYNWEREARKLLKFYEICLM